MEEMEDTKVDMSGQMKVPGVESRGQFDFSNFGQFQKMPSPMELFQITRNSIRPWSEFLNMANFKTAASMPRLSGRFVRNLSYFQSNYIFIFIILMIYCLVTSPLILLVLVTVGYACHKLRRAEIPLTLFGYELSTRHQVIAVNIAAVPVLFLAGAGAVLFWTLGASCFVICSHAIFYNIEAIVTEESEGFLSEVI